MKPKPLHILLADDDNDDTFLFQEALEQIPIHTTLDIAENGIELMETLKTYVAAPDLIFLDMNMPLKNGLECLSEIRKYNQFKDVPIIMLSTSVASYLLESACKQGANLYIQKPTSFSSLIKVIQRCLTQKEKLKHTFNLEQFLIKDN